jgi:hypothetical protein
MITGEEEKMSQEKGSTPSVEALRDLLPHLETLLARHQEHKRERFNIFDVLRVTWLELPHSNFLAFLLVPNGDHGWGTAFAEALIEHTFPDLLKGNGLGKLEVFREWQYIDILLRDEANQLVIIIENKITSDEGIGQPKSYWAKIEELHPKWNRKAIFLTPRGSEPSCSEYHAVGYDLIAQLIEDLLKQRASSMEPDMSMAIRQYAEMLRRHIVEDREINKVCQQIFQDHYAAIDYLNNYYATWLKDTMHKLTARIKALIAEQHDRFVLDDSLPSYIRFGMLSLRDVPELSAEGLLDRRYWWTKSGQLLLFVFANTPGSLLLDLYVHIGPEEVQDKIKDLRDRIERLVLQSAPVFEPITPNLPWLRIYQRIILPEIDYRVCNQDALFRKLEVEWKNFLETDFVSIERALRTEFAHRADEPLL